MGTTAAGAQQSGSDAGRGAKRPVLARAGARAHIGVGRVEGVPVAGRLQMRRLLRGRYALVVEFHLARGGAVPTHTHDHECYLYVLRGRLRSTVGGRVFDLRPGDAILYPAGVPHASAALADSVWLEVKTPPPSRWLKRV